MERRDPFEPVREQYGQAIRLLADIREAIEADDTRLLKAYAGRIDEYFEEYGPPDQAT